MMKGKSDINIQHPEVWELLVMIDDRRLDYILFTPTVAHSMISGQVLLGDVSLQALEDAIYETPELLNEYRRVRVVVRSGHFILLPDDVDDDCCLMLVRQSFPDDDSDAEVCHLAANGVKIAYLMPMGLMAFLGRTFNYPSVCHHLQPLCEHFKGMAGNDGVSRMFLHLNEMKMDAAIYSEGELQYANTYPYANVQDAAFFALSAWRANGLDQLTDELQLAGNGAASAELTPLLREYVKQVMPAAFPTAAMQLGRNAMQAPLELILLALCE